MSIDGENIEVELKDLKSNARNLEECLRTLVKRIDELEGRKVTNGSSSAASDPTVMLSSPRSDVSEASGGDVTKLVSETPRQESRTETVVGGDGVKRTFLTQQFITSTTKSYSTSPPPSSTGGTLSTFLLGGAGGALTNGQGKMDNVSVGVRKKKGDSHLGLTVASEGGQLLVSRILADSPLSAQGVVRVGDVIQEVNGQAVKTPEELQAALKSAGEGVQLKMIPSGQDRAPPPDGTYVKAHVDYEPKNDDKIPCKDIGLAFKVGDVLQIISKDDAQWWQARNVRDWSRIGLIPSESFEESRKAGSGVDASRKAALGGLVSIHKRNKVHYRISEQNGVGVGHIYEEMAKLSPYGRRVVCLVGASGVGRRTLKSMLLQSNPQAFATVVPITSRQPKSSEQEGREYSFKTRAEVQKMIDSGALLEWGELKGNLYGTSLDSVRKVIKSGRMCVLDCAPAAIKWIYSEEFMPYVVYVAPPPLEELRQLYKVHPNRSKPKTEEELKATCDAATAMDQNFAPLFDLHLVNRNLDVTFRRLSDALDSLKLHQQWVPATWLSG